MFVFSVNFLAVVVSAIAAMALGFAWYGPLFGKPWMKLSGMPAQKMAKAKKTAGKMYGLSAIGSMFTAYVLSLMINVTVVANLSEGLQLAAFLWLGFEAVVLYNGVLFYGKSWKLFAIDAGYQLVSMLVMATILTIWV